MNPLHEPTKKLHDTIISTARLKPEGELARPAEHLIASIRGALPGPTLIILGGIHGNEPAGVLAAERVWLRMQKRRAVLRGEVVLLRGNTRALAQRVRYLNADLNRQWTAENVRAAELERGTPEVSELLEQRELLMVIRKAINRARGEIYFVDLHTTSARSEAKAR